MTGIDKTKFANMTEEETLYALTSGLKVGVFTPNEVREFLGLPPIKGGDEAYVHTPQGAILVSKLAQRSSLHSV